ncbi:transcription-repair coupling factor [Tepidimicrobium xylanilyticum]|uniref:Transcription-repair-coupling factor n=2 Tax=Tepidimicrobium xylanilyticum TaxID=1123352 RepID=A0A1H2XPY3_9FIRM|nr:transcription-repair coupling factor [Tepidimicrobium xylanilyticum]GMG97559.1 transcription-repair-coupling factor [Tepidimicrobium xylanilyticum]SDW94903.1 transcription-repair coupling factor [Tepidimicrobium xylanilyticum]
MPNMFIDPFEDLSSYEKLIRDIEERKSISTYGIIDANIGHFCYALNQHLNRQILILTYDERRAERIYEDIKTFFKGKVELYPNRDVVFYKVDAISSERINNRIKILSRLAEGEPIIVVAHIEGVLNRLMSPALFKGNSIKIDYDTRLELDQLISKLIDSGYHRENMVEGIGQFSVRGGIVDFFPPNNDNPYRIELFDDEIDSIRTFNVETQRSLEMVESVYIPPVREVLLLDSFRDQVVKAIERAVKKATAKLGQNSKIKENIEDKFLPYIEEVKEKIYVSNMDMVIPFIPEGYLSSLLHYFNEDSIVFIDEPARIEERVKNIREQFLFKYSDCLEVGEVLPEHENINYKYKNIVADIKEKIIIANSPLLRYESQFKLESIVKFTTKSMQPYHNDMEYLKEELEDYKHKGYKVIIFSGTEERGKRLQSTLMDLGLICSFVEDHDRNIESGQIFITDGSINEGFEYVDIKLAFISDKEIFGSSKETRKRKIKSKKDTIDFSDLKLGDYVVHENHGIGVYEGIEQLNIQGVIKDYLTIRYKGNDKLYVPIDQMDLIQKYIGADSVKPKVNKLSSQDWVRTKKKAKKAVEDMAKDLLELYAKRESQKGFSFSKDTIWQNQFEDSFPFEETEAQIKSIEEIKKDMEKDKPMDRLLCGDVGYGKTEVALRAAFKSIMDEKQVAFLVPTTILAQQHYNTIIERFKDFPVNVAMLSRFKTAKEQKAIIEGLRKGTVDIVVGTHRLLSKDVVFKDLGLLIIDEEQRFGVKHKETLKKLKESIDVLTLTATPIPRTLHMSLIGIRDMSIIDEPPEERYPIQTYVLEFNEQMIREAILKEMGRKGQVYFVYNRVENIDKMAVQLKKLVPEARIAIGHGQMSERELEKVMMDFIAHEYDVLVCTTIIETGLDIPNVNTIIIYDADKMGLSQLYQLRGRVGRTNKVAYAYLTYQKDKVLTEVAEKRLRAIKDFTEFGAGFKIAMRDLEIRGAGNLLGVEQHGHIEAIGYDLYVKFLNQTIKRLKGEIVEEGINTTIDLTIDGYISDRYIEDEEQKIEVYKKIAAIRDTKDYLEVLDELIDRFGDVPQEVKNLMDISYIKNHASSCHIKNINQIGNTIILEFDSVDHISPNLIHYLSKEYGQRISFDLSNNPSFRFRSTKDLLSDLKELIEKITGFYNSTSAV